MGELFLKNKEVEYTKITTMLLKGKTIREIAQDLNYSKSTVSNRLNILFQKYKAKNRLEFAYNFLTKIIGKYKAKLETAEKENEKLKYRLLKLKTFIEENKCCKDESCNIIKKLECLN